jgi:hypothetical protein
MVGRAGGAAEGKAWSRRRRGERGGTAQEHAGRRGTATAGLAQGAYGHRFESEIGGVCPTCRWPVRSRRLAGLERAIIGRLPARLLSSALPRTGPGDAVLGNLHEEFLRRAHQSLWRARWSCTRQAVEIAFRYWLLSDTSARHGTAAGAFDYREITGHGARMQQTSGTNQL